MGTTHVLYFIAFSGALCSHCRSLGLSRNHGTRGTNAGERKYRTTRCNIHFKLEVFILCNKFLMLFCHLKFSQLKRPKTVKQSQIISSILNGIMNFYQMYTVRWQPSHSALGVPNCDGLDDARKPSIAKL